MSLAPPLSPSLFELDPDVVWVMHCAEAPVPRLAADAIRRALGDEVHPWALSLRDWLGAPDRVRAAAAALLGGAAVEHLERARHRRPDLPVGAG
jgi:cysteine desulfurase/selenocysteine lyase